MPFLHGIWSMPLQISLSLYLLDRTLGPPFWAGVSVMVLLVPLQTKIGGWEQTVQNELMRVRDERLKVTNGALMQIKVVLHSAHHANIAL